MFEKRPTISLDGDWLCQPDWKNSSIDSLPADLFKKDEYLSATVPGTIHTDLMAAGKISDPFRDDFENSVQWITEVGWCYRRTFDVDEVFLASKSVELRAEGLDTFARIVINDVEIGRTDNMFIRHNFDVGYLLRRTSNEIKIVFDSPLQRIRYLENCFDMPDTMMKFPRVYARKAQYSFGWDWGPRLTTSGIWRPICLVALDQVKLERFDIKQTISPALDHVSVTVDVECSGNSSQPLKYVASLLGPDYDLTLNSSSTDLHHSFAFEIQEPHLWWPHGIGEQPLYEVSIRVDVGHVQQFSLTRNIGLRRVELITEADTQGESFRLQVNDVPVFCKGVNWIPADNFIPRITEEKYRKLLTMARDADMNMIRVWGGGIYESPEFYDICDELGLMVWQDFMFACATYPEYDRFIDNVRNEVKTVVRELRDHPSVVVWCGNNENEQDWYKYLNRPYAEMSGHRIFADLIPDVLSEEDTSRPYRQSSPFGGEDPNSEHIGTRHQWNMWSNWASPTSVVDDRSRFVTEFGFQSPACLKTWQDYISEDELSPQSRLVEHHNKQVGGSERLYRYLAEQFKVPSTFEDFVLKTQVVQAEALKICIEHWRSQKFHTAGSIIWQFNDCWPVSSWSLIDCELRPKAAYWYAKRFFAPILLVIRKNQQSLDFLAVNDTLTDVTCRLVISIFGLQGKRANVRDQREPIPANKSTLLASYKLTELGIGNETEEYVRAQLLHDDTVTAENRYFFSPHKHFRLGTPNLESHLSERRDGNWSLEVVSDRFVKALHVELPEHEWQLSHDFLDVDAGEKVRFDIQPIKSGHGLRSTDIAMKWIQ